MSEVLSPTYIGPSWATDDDGNFLLPEHTLGWEIAGWCSQYILDPNSSSRDPKPWHFTNEQLRILLWWYAVDDKGRFIYRQGVLQRMKGWGKDPLLAVMALVELCGPSRFDYWDAKGLPVAKPHQSSWVQIVAVSREQTRNTMRMFPNIISDDLKRDYALDIGIEFIRANQGRCSLEAVTSSFRSLEGGRTTFTLLNEALSVDTAIPTPRGFVRMGDLEVGDRVYGKDGVPTPVTYVTDEEEGRACFKVTLPNGENVIASEGHLWTTKVTSSAAKPKIRTTLEMVEDGRKFQIPRAGMRHSDNTPLPVDPYILGAWLGDGSTGDCNITIGPEDEVAMCAEFARRGVVLHEVGHRTGSTAGRFGWSNRKGFGSDMGTELAQTFRGLPCYRNKFIPDEYMVAGHEQRLELLRGLMDTDGCVTKDGYCIFIGRKRLADDLFELAASLGYLPFRKFIKDERSRDGGYWNIHFLLEGENCFSLPRKRDRVPVKPRRKWVTISCEQIPTTPVRCISVGDEPNSLFQAGLSFVTHNTQHWVPGNQGNLMYETIDNNAAKGIESRYIAITNAYLPGEESVGETMRNAYNDILEGRAQNYGFMYDSIEANPKTELSPESLREVIPLIRGDSVWVNPDNIISSAMKTDVSPARSRRMWLNQIVADEDAVYQESDWDKLDSPNTPLRPGDEIVMGFDGGKSDDATALVAVRISDGYVEPILIEQRPPISQRDHMPDGKPPHWEVNKDYVDSKVRAAFSRYKVRGFYCDVALWEPYIADWAKDYGEGLDVKAPGRNACAWDMRNHLRVLVQGHEALIQTVLDGKLKHAPYSESALAARMRRHVLNARRRENRFGVSFGKESPDSPKKVDAYAALLLAVMAWNDLKQRMPEQTTRRGFFF